MSGKLSTRAVGLGFGIASAFAFATTVVTGRSLARADVDFPLALGIPFTLGGLILLASLAVRGRRLIPSPGEFLWVLFLGAGIYATQSAWFFSGLERGTAAAVTLLFYGYPAMVVIIGIPLDRRMPRRATVGAVVLSLAGVALIVATSGDVDITRAGAAFSLGAAGMFAVNLMVSERTVRTTDSATTAAWLGLGTGVAQLLWGALTRSVESPGGHWDQLLGLGFSRAAAFAFMFAALRRLGSADTSVALTFEALFAILLAAAFIDESVTAVQAVGGLAVFLAAVVIARAPELDEVETGAPPP